jgi:hypothetical protein
VIIGVGVDKGSPGASTLALLLGMCWPTERVLVELDPRGADLAYRCAAAGGRPLAATPSVTTLAIDARPGAMQRALPDYAQSTACAVPVIVGETSPTRFSRIAPHLPALTGALTRWPGTVIADLGSLQPGSPTLTVARAATAVVLVTGTDVASLGHLRDRVEELAVDLGDSSRTRSALAVVVRADGGDASAARQRVEQLLASIGSPTPVIGVLPTEPATVQAVLAGRVTRRMARGALLGEVLAVTVRLCTSWPELTAPSLAGFVPSPTGRPIAASGLTR